MNRDLKIAAMLEASHEEYRRIELQSIGVHECDVMCHVRLRAQEEFDMPEGTYEIFINQQTHVAHRTLSMSLHVLTDIPTEEVVWCSKEIDSLMDKDPILLGYVALQPNPEFDTQDEHLVLAGEWEVKAPLSCMEEALGPLVRSMLDSISVDTPMMAEILSRRYYGEKAA